MSVSKSPSRIRLFLGGLWPRVPILHRYLARELSFVALLTATVLTSLMALCGLLQPLGRYGITATEMLEILILLFPFFLVFTVPFALMLACCWVYGRLSADNELSACSSSGINIQTLLIVPLLLGLGTMILSVVLANWLVPNWALDRFEVLVARHGKDIVYRQLNRRGSYTLDRYQIDRRCIIHADRIDPDNDVLSGIGVAIFARDTNQVEQIITAQSANLSFFSSDENADRLDSIAIVPLQATVVTLPEYDVHKAASLEFSGRIRQKISESFSAMSLDDLMALGDDPERHSSVRNLAQEARRIAVASELVKRLHADRTKYGYFELYGPKQERYRFTGSAPKPLFSIKGAGNILEDATIEEYLPGGTEPVRVFENVKQVNLELVELPASMAASQTKPAPAGLTASMVLRNAHIRELAAVGQETVLEHTHFSISQLAIPEDIIQRGMGLSVQEIKQADFPRPTPKRLRGIARQMIARLAKLSKEVSLEIHSRMAIAVCCPVLAILGALLGAIFRRGQFIVAAGLSLVPAMVALLFIIMGKRMVDSDVFSTGMAVAVAWTGLILLSAANVFLLVKVLKR